MQKDNTAKQSSLFKKIEGFTLIEMLLVLVIASMIIYLALGYIQQKTLTTRMDRTSLQMQQILNAGLSYYVANGKWPANIDCLEGTGDATCIQYIPKDLTSPWGDKYKVLSKNALFYVYAQITSASASGSAAATANTIAGTLPLAYTTSTTPNPPSAGTACATASTSCYVVASVNIPGQNLNNATAVNFAGLYKHGGCVPVPRCPVDANGNTMTPEIMVVPVSVSGVNDANSSQVYPISSFTAYAKGPPSANPPACDNYGPPVACDAANAPSSYTPTYWRACLQVVTEKGDVAETNVGGLAMPNPPTAFPWGGNVTLMAITRCAIKNEPSGSPFTVFSQ